MTTQTDSPAGATLSPGAPLSSVANPRCPRHVRAAAAMATADPLNFKPVRRWIRAADLPSDPFRLFFPLAVLAGVIGVTLWPLMLGGWMEEYPGTRHARLMIVGFFGGFVLGFLGTSLPRLLETAPLRAFELGLLLVGHAVAIGFHTAGSVEIGDAVTVATLAVLAVALGRRVPKRQDLPPPGFILIPAGFLCLVAGFALDAAGRRLELPPSADLLARLLGYHGFILLCILGAGGFLLPRFLGLGVKEKFPTTPQPTPAWRRSAGVATVTAVAIIGSYLLEAGGWPRTAAVLRAGSVVGYLARVMPLGKLRWSNLGVQPLLLVGLASVPLGILLAGFWPGWRVALSHVELVAGFGLVTLGVATRVIYGHSGQRSRLERVHRGFLAAAILMVLGLLSRISGDLTPAIQVGHYWYGAVCWVLGLLVWSIAALPKILRPDPEA